MKKVYGVFCKFESLLASAMLLFITVLAFVSAVTRFFGYPINWAQDACIVVFAWMIFLGSDIAVRGPGLIGIDLLVKRLPKFVQKVLDITFKIIIIGFLCVLVYNGGIMVTEGWKREITTLGISYGWVTLAVPVGAFFMIISTAIRLVESVKKPLSAWGTSEAPVEKGVV